MITWQWSKFADLSVHDLYALLQRREQVFVLEQTCLYADIDGLDPKAWHLLAWQEGEAGRELAACLRYFPPGVRYPEASLGRVLSAPEARGSGIGRALMAEALRRAETMHPGQSFRIAAQHYLQDFYAGFGFKPIGETYEEDEIIHIDMLRA